MIAGKFHYLLNVKEKSKYLFFSDDPLTIYDGGSSTSPMMGKYCGDSVPPSHVSSSNEILVHFQSDWVGAKTGFHMEYNPTGNNTSFKTTLSKSQTLFGNVFCKKKSK